MEPAIITAIIGAAGTVVAALVSLQRGQTKNRHASTEQHGQIYDMLERTFVRTADIHRDILDVKKKLNEHLDDHDGVVFLDEVPAPARKKPAAKKLK
ncbi:hypothetical protein UFOVP1296_46 [uncultured Caudovirales phage]|uniref:Uncharacterized protein n=1 Tax=uncultured Caudovirales phage TaxID=2100421 RepID=A0A6J5RNZ5_9CAUD|nr:hypothetical protein UFOVP471_48 [uncultured Caudovirales phage]CAB4169511.1 hypothetical protein UFOVP890_46 [uncultured Caudovirales phage]CAB4195946.1 hypothetical protein UFOVP1296_46 [uncultured Caudovirales phage]